MFHSRCRQFIFLATIAAALSIRENDFSIPYVHLPLNVSYILAGMRISLANHFYGFSRASSIGKAMKLREQERLKAELSLRLQREYRMKPHRAAKLAARLAANPLLHDMRADEVDLSSLVKPSDAMSSSSSTPALSQASARSTARSEQFVSDQIAGNQREEEAPTPKSVVSSARKATGRSMHSYHGGEETNRSGFQSEYQSAFVGDTSRGFQLPPPKGTSRRKQHKGNMWVDIVELEAKKHVSVLPLWPLLNALLNQPFDALCRRKRRNVLLRCMLSASESFKLL